MTLTERWPALARPRGWPWALLVVLAVGALVRIGGMLALQPASLTLSDQQSYILQASGDVFGDPNHPAGYGLVLRTLHLAFHDVTWTLAVQHVAMLITAVLLYRAVRGIGSGRAAATAVAAVLLLNGDLMYLEHSVMSDAAFTIAITLAACAALMTVRAPRELRAGITTRDAWLLAAGLLLGVSAVMRFVGAPLLVLFAVWAAVVFARPWRSRLRTAAFAASGGLAILVAYVVLNGALAGTWGLTGQGWGWYVRSAQFANCDRFTPPKGTERLCEDTPPGTRPGPDFYSYNGASPAVRVFGPSPAHSDEVNAFGKAAILHQPLDYAKTVANDFVRYFAPTYANRRQANGDGNYLTDWSRRAGPVEETLIGAFNNYYDDEDVRVRGGVLSLYDYQQIFRLHGLLLLAAVLFGAVGFGRATRDERAVIALGTVGGLVLMVFPIATIIYSARYTIPASPLLAVGAVVGLRALARGRPAAPAPAASRAEAASAAAT